MKNPLALAAIEPATFRFVAQHLDHCATAVPLRSNSNATICTVHSVSRMVSVWRLFNRSLCLAKGLSQIITACLGLRATVSGRQAWDRRAVSLLALLACRSDGDVHENSSLVRFYTVATGKQVLTFKTLYHPTDAQIYNS